MADEIEKEKKRGPGETFLGRLYAALKERFSGGDFLSSDDFASLFRSARGHAGGKVSRPKPKDEMGMPMAEDGLMECPECGADVPMDADVCPECGAAMGADAATEPALGLSDLADLAAAGHPYRLFNAISFADAPEWIAYLPMPGTYKHPRYGDIKITKERNARFVDNFTNKVYQDRLPVDAEHETKLSGATGWITQMRVNTDGSADARVEWTDRGKALIAADRFKYFSPEWYDEWRRPETGELFKDIAIGGALCTRPFFKDPALRPLVASEGVFIDVPELQGVDHMADEQKFAELERKAAEQATALIAREAEIAALKTATEQAQQAAEAAIKQAAERVAALELARRTDRFTSLIASEKWVGERDGIMTVLNALADTAGEESAAFKAYVTQQKATAEIAAKSKLFEEVGTDGGGSTGDATTQLQRMASERVKDGLSFPDALAQIADEHPELYAQHSAAATVRAGKGA